MTGVLLWINKDASAQTLLHSSRAERSTVQSLIQRGRPRKRQRVQVKAGYNVRTSARPRELYDRSTRSLSGEFDPFNVACARIDSTAHGLLRYYVYHMHPSMWPNEPTLVGGAYAYKSSVTKIMETAIQDSLMLFSLLTSATCRLSYVDHLQFPNVAKNEQLYSTKALQLMRSRVEAGLAQPDHESQDLLQCIAFLMSAESYRDNFAVSRTHLKAALALLNQQLGGIQNLKQKHLQGQFLMADLYLSCVDLTPCICDCFYDPGPASVLQFREEESVNAPNADDLGAAILSLDSSSVPFALIQLIEDIIETYQVKAMLNRARMSWRRTMEIGHWITYRNMATRNKLLAIPSTDVRLEALRVTLIMWTLLAMNFTGRVKTVKIMASSLQSILMRGFDHVAPNDAQLLLWILSIGFSCSASDSALEAWYVAQIRRTEMLRSMTTTADVTRTPLADILEDFQKGYLYHPAIQRPLTMRLATLLQHNTTPRGLLQGYLPI